MNRIGLRTLRESAFFGSFIFLFSIGPVHTFSSEASLGTITVSARVPLTQEFSQLVARASQAKFERAYSLRHEKLVLHVELKAAGQTLFKKHPLEASVLDKNNQVLAKVRAMTNEMSRATLFFQPSSEWQGQYRVVVADYFYPEGNVVLYATPSFRVVGPLARDEYAPLNDSPTPSWMNESVAGNVSLYPGNFAHISCEERGMQLERERNETTQCFIRAGPLA